MNFTPVLCVNISLVNCVQPLLLGLAIHYRESLYRIGNPTMKEIGVTNPEYILAITNFMALAYVPMLKKPYT